MYDRLCVSSFSPDVKETKEANKITTLNVSKIHMTSEELKNSLESVRLAIQSRLQSIFFVSKLRSRFSGALMTYCRQELVVHISRPIAQIPRTRIQQVASLIKELYELEKR